MRYVVTGAAGFIGSHLAEALTEHGHEVVSIDCFTDYYDPLLKEENAARLDVVHVDLARGEHHELFAGAEGVFHLAGQPGVRSFGDVFSQYVERNILATQKVFECAAQAGARVVFASSSSIYGDAESYPTQESVQPAPRSPYGITKLACEHLFHAYADSFGLDGVALRYFTVYGPRQRPDMAFARIAASLASGEFFEMYGDGGQSRSFTYVADAVAATIRAMERAPTGATYNVGGGAEATLLEAIDHFERIGGKRLDVRFVPGATGDVRRTSADVRRIRVELGWAPTTSLEEGIAEQWSWTVARAPVSGTR